MQNMYKAFFKIYLSPSCYMLFSKFSQFQAQGIVCPEFSYSVGHIWSAFGVKVKGCVSIAFTHGIDIGYADRTTRQHSFKRRYVCRTKEGGHNHASGIFIQPSHFIVADIAEMVNSLRKIQVIYKAII
ncbi:hypothetical protein AXF13_10760 [Desulfovibrio fairfieldensis]|uniref:Uncharacterized protein n=1 Tax=Desulfovibrio fairfieldensis TaxID=44742 RepID=A0A109W4K5_9BACT|nr:hypothetical protein AXF13_10760 [Desulfovibrio fairfieldensis]